MPITEEPQEKKTRKERVVWTEEMADKAKNLFKQGFKANVISQNIGVAPATLRRNLPEFFKKHKNVKTHKQPVATQESRLIDIYKYMLLEAQIYEKYAENLREIAAEYKRINTQVE